MARLEVLWRRMRLRGDQSGDEEGKGWVVGTGGRPIFPWGATGAAKVTQLTRKTRDLYGPGDGG